MLRSRIGSGATATYREHGILSAIAKYDRWPLRLLSVVALVLLGAEVFLVFVERDGVFAIEGRDDYEIAEFGGGAVVAHAFLMRGDGMHSVGIRLTSDMPAAATIRWVLYSGTPDGSSDRWRLFSDTPESPSEMVRAFNGVAAVSVSPGRQWYSIRFPRHGSSNDRWFTLEIQLLDVTSGSDRPRLRPQLFIAASRDNPHRGGVLWVDGKRQSGSLFLRAETTGRTLYRRFLAGAAPHLPRVLQIPFVQWTAFALLHGAFLVFAYSVIRDGVSSR